MNDVEPLPEDLRADMRAWRRHLHRHPELGPGETATADFVARVLVAAGLEVHRGIGGTGVVGVLNRGASPRAVALRAELDALPIHERDGRAHRSTADGCMHACGHDGHMSMLLGAAHLLARDAGFEGTAVFVFQPDEERGTGARAMIADGLFRRFPADAIFAVHNIPGIPAGHFALRSGAMMACEDHFRIDLTGQGTHAAFPHMGTDLITAGAEIVQALQTIVSRGIDPRAGAVVSVTDFATDGGTNILPGRVTLTGDARSYGTDVGRRIEERMARIAAGVAAAHGAAHRFDYTRKFVATRNTPAEAEFARRVAEAVVGPARVAWDCAALLASDDFGVMLEEMPGAYVFLGNGDSPPLHNPGYDFDDANLDVGARFLAGLATAHCRDAGRRDRPLSGTGRRG